MVADGGRRGYEHMLNVFWDEAEDFGLQLPTATPVRKESFCAARHKLLPKTMKKLLRRLTGAALDSKPEGTWNGRRVFAVDGCKVNLQPREELIDAFGLPKKAHCPQILVSVMLDVVSGVPVDVELSGYRGNEREHLIAMLAGVAPGSLIILDRGYPSYEVIRMLTDAGIDFLIRVCEDGSFKATRSLKENQTHETNAWLDCESFRKAGASPIPVRLVELEGPNGTSSAYVTSLLPNEFDRGDIKELYHLRWSIEEFYKQLKGNYVGQGQFRSRTAQGVEQEVYAAILFLALSRLVTHTAELKLDDCGQIEDGLRLTQKASVLVLQVWLTRLFLAQSQPRASEAMRSILAKASRVLDRSPRDRHFPRRSKKPRLRWSIYGGRNA